MFSFKSDGEIKLLSIVSICPEILHLTVPLKRCYEYFDLNSIATIPES